MPDSFRLPVPWRIEAVGTLIDYDCSTFHSLLNHLAVGAYHRRRSQPSHSATDAAEGKPMVNVEPLSSSLSTVTQP